MRRQYSGPLNAPVEADQTAQQTGTAIAQFVSPAIQHQHPSAVKAWGHFLLSATGAVLITGYNVSTISIPAVGMHTIFFTNHFAAAQYGVMAVPIQTSGSNQAIAQVHTLATNSCVIYVKNGSTGSLQSGHLGIMVEIKGLLA